MKGKYVFKLLSLVLALCLFFSIVPMSAMAEMSAEPEPTVTPTQSVEQTANPTPSEEATPSLSESVEPTEEPTPGESVEPTESPVSSESVEPVGSPAPSESVEPTESPAPSESVKPTESMTPEPNQIVEPTQEEIDAAFAELAAAYPTLEEFLAAYPTLESLLADYPMLAGIITDYPSIEDTKEEEPLPEPEFVDPDNLGSPQYANNERKSGASSAASSSMTTRSLLMTASSAPEWPEEGAVYVDKSATGTVTPGEYQIDLEVLGKNTESTSDIVLVLDDSGSMSGSKLSEMKSAANDFVDGLIDGSGNIRIAIVTINGGSGTGEPGVIAEFTSNATTLHNAINGVSASGGTNLQGGLWKARQLIDGSSARQQEYHTDERRRADLQLRARCDPADIDR